jgi:hypothetical protein
MNAYQTLLNTAQTARAKAQMQLSELRLAISNLRNELAHHIQAPEGCITFAQRKPDGEPRTLDFAHLTYTEANTIEFYIRVRLDGSHGTVTTLSVPISIFHMDVGIMTIVEDSAPNSYQLNNNANCIKLILNSLTRQADEVGVQ